MGKSALGVIWSPVGLALVGLGMACSPLKGTPPIDAAQPTGLEISSSTISARVGLDGTTQLMAKQDFASQVDPDVTAIATWTSSDPSVATVEQGLVTPVAAGTSTITASYGGFMATATFTGTTPTMVLTTATGSIEFFNDPTTAGAGSADRIITGVDTQLEGFVWEVQVVGSNFYVSAASSGAILEFPLDGSGDIAPLATFKGSASGITYPLGMRIYNNELFVAQLQSPSNVEVFEMSDLSAGSADPTPNRVITGFTEAQSVEIYNNELYVADPAARVIDVFPIDASGSATPTRVISGSGTDFLDPDVVLAYNGELFIGDDESHEIAVYPPTGSDGASALRRITGNAVPALYPTQIRRLGDQLYIVDWQPQAICHVPIEATSDVPCTGVLQQTNEPRGIAFY